MDSLDHGNNTPASDIVTVDQSAMPAMLRSAAAMVGSAGGAYLLKQGVVDASGAAIFAGIVMSVASFAYGIYRAKRRTDKTVLAAKTDVANIRFK